MNSPHTVVSALERATNFDRALDAAIANACGFTRVASTQQRWRGPSGQDYEPLPRFTYSLDAGKALALEMFPKLPVAIVWGEGENRAQIEGGPACYAATAPIALCLAVLRKMTDG